MCLFVGGSTHASQPLPELALPDGVSIDLLYLRGQQINRRAALRVTNGSDVSLLVVEAQLLTDLLEPVPANLSNVAILPGRTVDVFVDLGAAICPAPGDATRAALTVEIGGTPFSGSVVVPERAVVKINRLECDQRYVADRVTLSFDDAFLIEDGHAHTRLNVQRVVGTEPVRIDYVRGTVTMGIAAIPPTEAPVATLAAGANELSIPLDVWVARCDDHAVIESKRNYEFRVWVTVGEVEEQLMIVKVPDGGELWTQLEELMHACNQGASPADGTDG